MEQRLITPGHIILQETGREGLLFDLDRDAYFAVNHTARTIWQFIEAGSGVTAGAIIDHIVDRTGADRQVVSRDVDPLLNQWRSMGLLVATHEETES